MKLDEEYLKFEKATAGKKVDQVLMVTESGKGELIETAEAITSGSEDIIVHDVGKNKKTAVYVVDEAEIDEDKTSKIKDEGILSLVRFLRIFFGK